MTWAKDGVTAQGFNSPPTDQFIVPFHGPSPSTLNSGLGNTVIEQTLAASGVMGHYHTERGLTLVNIVLSGHMVPQYAPSASLSARATLYDGPVVRLQVLEWTGSSVELEPVNPA